MLGFYENFPQTIHFSVAYTYMVSTRKLQQSLIQILKETNRKNQTFEEVAIPTVPNSTVIFEWGIADASDFTSIDEDQAQKLLKTVEKKPLQIIDLFCNIRYYKNAAGKRQPLKFDYYLTRLGFTQKKMLTVQVFHERGPRYLSPEDLTEFLVGKVNGTSTRKTLQPAE